MLIVSSCSAGSLLHLYFSVFFLFYAFVFTCIIAYFDPVNCVGFDCGLVLEYDVPLTKVLFSSLTASGGRWAAMYA